MQQETAMQNKFLIFDWLTCKKSDGWEWCGCDVTLYRFITLQIKGFTIKIKSECLQTLLDSSVVLVYKTVQIKMLAFSFCTHFEP